MIRSLPVAVLTRTPKDLRPHRLRHQSMQAPLDRAPINIREERFDVLGPIRWFVIKYERMLPNVHHQHRIETGDVARLVQADPMIRQLSVRRVLVTDGPTNAPHLADADKVSLPNIVTAERLFGGFAKAGPSGRIAGAAAALQVVEIIFVQHHAVVFETQPPSQFRVFGELVLIDSSVL